MMDFVSAVTAQLHCQHLEEYYSENPRRRKVASIAFRLLCPVLAVLQERGDADIPALMCWLRQRR